MSEKQIQGETFEQHLDWHVSQLREQLELLKQAPVGSDDALAAAQALSENGLILSEHLVFGVLSGQLSQEKFQGYNKQLKDLVDPNFDRIKAEIAALKAKQAKQSSVNKGAPLFSGVVAQA